VNLLLRILVVSVVILVLQEHDELKKYVLLSDGQDFGDDGYYCFSDYFLK
jgi:hypothetical protein